MQEEVRRTGQYQGFEAELLGRTMEVCRHFGSLCSDFLERKDGRNFADCCSWPY